MSELIFSSTNRQENYKISKMLQEKKSERLLQGFIQQILKKHLPPLSRKTFLKYCEILSRNAPKEIDEIESIMANKE